MQRPSPAVFQPESGWGRRMTRFLLMDSGGQYRSSHGSPSECLSGGGDRPGQGLAGTGLRPARELRLRAAAWKSNPVSRVLFKTHSLLVLPRAILHLLFHALPTYLQVLIEQTLARAQ